MVANSIQRDTHRPVACPVDFHSGGNIPSFALDLVETSDHAGQMPSSLYGLLSESSDWTLEISFESDKSASGNHVIFAVTNGTNDRMTLNQEGSNLRARVYDAGTTKAKSGNLSDINGIQTAVFTNDASGDAVKLWLNTVEQVGTNAGAMSGTTGGYVGAASSGADLGANATFDGRIWNFRLWTQKISALSEIASLAPNRLFSFHQSTASTSNDEKGSGDIITWQNSPSFVAIPT